MNEIHYRLVLNFFYFLLLDEALAISAAYKAIKKFKRLTKSKTLAANSIEVSDALIKTIIKIYTQYRTHKQIVNLPPPKSDWKIPKTEYMIAWKEFMRRADPLFSEMLVLHFILGFKPETIAHALDLPTGTITFRLGRGLESLAESSVIKTLAPR
jgi:DNA-directed RNA polymerase specialized sigma24 family protein